MVLIHFPRRRKNLVAGIFVLVGIYWLLRQHELLTSRLRTAVVKNSCWESLPRLENRAVSWPTVPRSDGKIGDDAIDTLLDLREFENCVMFNDGLDETRIIAIERGLFPYLDLDGLHTDDKKFWPHYKRWDGQSAKGATPKFAKEDYKFLGFSRIKYDRKLSFWGNWLKNVVQPGSKGITISVGNAQVEDCARLLKVLRHLGNKFPIEIVHRGDLSQVQQDKLIRIATEKASQDFPIQDLWFLDISSMLNPIYADHFKTFSNKWLALILSSFQNPVLLDADVIPFTSLDIYYDFPQFTTTGALYFKDRKVNSDLLDSEQLSSLRRILATLTGITLTENENDESMGNKIRASIKDEIAAQTLINMLVKGQKHHMESGLVLLDKKQHLISLLSSLALQFSSISKYFHGDKEWFWIAQILQRQSFTFHPKDASNVGTLGKVVTDENAEFLQLCSVQLSHTDVDGSLLWINGGLRTCKKDAWDSDYKDNARLASMFDSEEALREYYQSPVKLEGAIIPDTDIKPWLMTGECAMFNYCTLYKEGAYGEVIKFSNHQKEFYKGIVRVWNSDINNEGSD